MNRIGKRRSPHPPCRLATADDPYQDDQDAGADEGDDDTAPEAIRPPAEEAHQYAAEERADQAHDNVAEDAVAAALHHLSREPARDQANDQPGDDPARFE